VAIFRQEARTVEGYLKEPRRQPDYRSGRRHADFLGNLPLSAGEIGTRLSRMLDLLANCCSLQSLRHLCSADRRVG
jgi:hypothetical protein